MSQTLFRNADRRRDPRVGARFEVAFNHAKDAAKAFKTFSVNFSAGGLCLRSQRPHALGEVVELHLTVEGQDFELSGTVQWVRGGVVGVRFTEMQPEVRERLAQVAKAMIAKGAPIVDDP